MQRRTWIAVATLVVAAALPACGDDAAPGGTGTTTTTSTNSGGAGQGGDGQGGDGQGGDGQGGDGQGGDGQGGDGQGGDGGQGGSGQGGSGQGGSGQGGSGQGGSGQGGSGQGGSGQGGSGQGGSGQGGSGQGGSGQGGSGQGGQGGSAAVCGDGAVAASEACDDGDLDAGDGCDGACAVEAGYSCAGEPSACSTSCGDGVVAGAEACDDGNNVGGDCCSAACQLEPECEVEPNNSAPTANGPFTQDVLIKAAIGPIADQDYFSFTVTTTSDIKLETFDQAGPGSCVSIDTLVDLYEPDGTTVRANDDDDGAGNCSLLDPAVDAAAQALAAGTYFVRVHEYNDNDAIPGYRLQLTFVSVCGDGTIAGSETCDDSNTTAGDGCDAACRIEPVCGDGTVTPPEACDDGGTVPGDGCSATCTSEYYCGDGIITPPEACDDSNMNSGDGCSATCAWDEVEPNGTSATASGPYPADAIVQAAITPIGDQDYFVFTVTAPSDVTIETFDPSGPSSCSAGNDTLVDLLAPDGTTVLASDDDDGPANCSLIDAANDIGARQLAPGTYFIRSRYYNDTVAIAGYTLRVTFTAVCGDGVLGTYEVCDDGNLVDGDGCPSNCRPTATETEPNNTSVEANGPFTSGVVFLADISPAFDDDWVAVTVPGPASTITATTLAGAIDTCGPGGAIDSEVQIYATDGTTSLALNDDINGSTNWCSSAQATGLPAGTYFVRTAGSAAYCDDCTYDYSLQIQVQ